MSFPALTSAPKKSSRRLARAGWAKYGWPMTLGGHLSGGTLVSRSAELGTGSRIPAGFQNASGFT